MSLLNPTDPAIIDALARAIEAIPYAKADPRMFEDANRALAEAVLRKHTRNRCPACDGIGRIIRTTERFHDGGWFPDYQEEDCPVCQN